MRPRSKEYSIKLIRKGVATLLQCPSFFDFITQNFPVPDDNSAMTNLKMHKISHQHLNANCALHFQHCSRNPRTFQSWESCVFTSSTGPVSRRGRVTNATGATSASVINASINIWWINHVFLKINVSLLRTPRINI